MGWETGLPAMSLAAPILSSMLSEASVLHWGVCELQGELEPTQGHPLG